MPLALGDSSSVRTREVSPSDIKAVAITSPVGGDSFGSPVLINYTVESDALVTAATIEVDFSIDSGENWATATAETGHASHSGTVSLAADADSESYIFVWDSSDDIGTSAQHTTVQLRLRATDQSSRYSEYAITDDFTIDMLPAAPVLVSPADGYFDAGDGATFVWEIPTDPGSDKIAFQLEVDDSPSFDSPEISHNSVDNLERFQHKISTDPSLKNAANGLSYYVKSFSVSDFSAAVSYGDLTSYFDDATLPSSLTNPQILLVNRSDRRCYIDYATITSTGFTINKSLAGVDDDGLVDLFIFSGSAGSFETYWVNLTITSNTSYTLGSSPFDTDVLGNSIPSSISGLRPQVLEGSDRGVYFSSITDSGFTVNVSEAYVDSSAKVRICLRGTPSESYVHEAYSITSASGQALDFNQALDDETNGGAAWPDYMPGAIVSNSNLADRMCYLSGIDNDQVTVKKSSYGMADDGSVDLHGHSEDPSTLPWWVDISPQGVPDSHEGEQARYRLKTEDELSDAEYYWRVTGANIT